MTVFRLDDLSPVIQYDASWRVGTPESDALFSRYSDDGTFHVSNVSNSNATLEFVGTSIRIFGAKRSNHDAYTVNLDGTDVSASGKGDDQFGAVLFDSGVLSRGPHSVIVRNTALIPDRSVANLDIDWIEVTAEVPQFQRRVEHTDFEVSGNILLSQILPLTLNLSRSQYTPAESWSTSHAAVESGHANFTGHVVQLVGATAKLTFRGSAVEIYGTVCPTCGQFKVSVDAASVSSTFSASNAVWMRPGTLFHASRDLEEGMHTVRITAVDSRALAINHAVIYSSSSYDSGNQSPHDDRSKSKKPALAAILGGTFGVVGASLILVFLFLFWRRRQHKQTQPPRPPYVSVPTRSTGLDLDQSQRNASTPSTTISSPRVAPLPYDSSRDEKLRALASISDSQGEKSRSPSRVGSPDYSSISGPSSRAAGRDGSVSGNLPPYSGAQLPVSTRERPSQQASWTAGRNPMKS